MEGRFYYALSYYYEIPIQMNFFQVPIPLFLLAGLVRRTSTYSVREENSSSFYDKVIESTTKLENLSLSSFSWIFLFIGNLERNF